MILTQRGLWRWFSKDERGRLEIRGTMNFEYRDDERFENERIDYPVEWRLIYDPRGANEWGDYPLFAVLEIRAAADNMRYRQERECVFVPGCIFENINTGETRVICLSPDGTRVEFR